MLISCNGKVMPINDDKKKSKADKTFELPDNYKNLVTSKISLTKDSIFKELKRGMTQKTVYRLVGIPSRHEGSGIAYDVDDLNGNKSVWVAWLKGKAAWAFIRNHDNSKTVIFK